MELDEIRIKIINALIEDAGRSGKQLSVAVGISESYVSKIIKDLTEFEKYIKKFSVDVDYDKVGYSTHAITFLKIKEPNKDNIHFITEKISNLNEAVDVYTVFGEWHICIRWICKTNSAIMENINNVMESSNVEKIETITLGKCYKRVYGPNLI